MRGAWSEAEGSIVKGIDADGVAVTEADHFMKCRQWFNMRDLGQAIEHVHNAEIEIGEGPEPAGTRRGALKWRKTVQSH
jgi:hypothetical protein